jgi:hypothetical protein
MRSLAWALLLLSTLLLTSGRAPERHVIEVSNAGELMELMATPLDNVIVQIAPGTYELTPTEGLEPSTNYCGANSALVPATIGLTMSGRKVTLRGSREGETVIVTNASHGIYLKDCQNCEIERLNITGINLSYSGDTAYGAIIVRNSSGLISNCAIHCAHSEHGEVTQAAGIAALHGADLNIEFNEIVSSGFGILILHGAQARIAHNVLEGRSTGVGVVNVDTWKAVGMNVGAGVVARCDAVGVVERNHLRMCRSGVEASEKASLEMRANIIEDMTGDGIVSTSGDLGRVRIEKNAIYRCGGAGISMRVAGDQRGSSNFVVETGLASPRASAIVLEGAKAEAAIRKNTLYDNTVTDASLDRDVPREIFWRERRGWTRTYRNTPVGVDGRHKFHESAFLTRYGRWLH